MNADREIRTETEQNVLREAGADQAPLAVMYGAGKIGRGFIGQKMAQSGYRVCFLDVVPSLVNEINEAGGYDVFIVSDGKERIEPVRGVCAYLADSEAGRQAMAECALMATAVGARNLEGAAKNIAAALEKRATENRPLNIILAENQMDVDKRMRTYLDEYLSEKARAWSDENVGLVAASVQRMVPAPDAEHQKKDPLCVVTEKFSELPVDADAICGDVPPLVNLTPFSPFSYHEKRKLYMHNMAHALCAYLGKARGYSTIWECVGDEEIRSKTDAALQTVGSALSKEYGVSADELRDYAAELLERFANRSLGDTVARVGADPIRKLRRDDRLTGAALYVAEMGLDPDPVVTGIVSALRFDEAADQSAAELQNEIKERGLESALEKYLGLRAGSELADKIMRAEAEERASGEPERG